MAETINGEQDERVQIESRSAWRSWLAENHDRNEGIWLVSSRSIAARSMSPITIL